MNLKDLKKEMPFKWRVQSTNEWGCTCVAYIDARDVQDIFDNVVGAANWQVKYEEHKGNLFASIGIRQYLESMDEFTTDDNWVWKSDCGTESQVEKQKGEASDAFKRAAVMWGVGRFLYSLGIIKIKEVVKDGKDRNGKDRYAPALNGKKIWDINTHCNNIHSGKTKQPKKVEPKKVADRKPSLKISQFDAVMKSKNVGHINFFLKECKMDDTQRKELERLVK